MEKQIIPEYRRKRIVELLRQKESLSVNALSELIGVSPATIRRDLKKLNRQGIARRSHGGAVLVVSQGTTFEPTFEMASKVAQHEKEKIAKAAAETLQDGQSIILDSGSTVVEMARQIRDKQIKLTVVTNDLLVGSLLSNSPNIKLIVLGGELRGGSHTLLGEPGMTFIGSLHTDAAFIGIQAIKGTQLCDTSTDVCKMKRLMVAASNRAVLLVDSTKFDQTAFCDVCSLEQIDTIFTDDAISQKIRSDIEALGIDIVVV